MIYLGADHGGFELKEKVKTWLTEWGEAFTDMGASALQPDDDFPQYAFAVATEVGSQERRVLPWKDRVKGILLCRSSAGMVIAANKVLGVRAVSCWDAQSTRHAREHNDANVIGISGDWTDEAKAKEIVKLFLTTEFSTEERHARRVHQLLDFEASGGCGCC